MAEQKITIILEGGAQLVMERIPEKDVQGIVESVTAVGAGFTNLKMANGQTMYVRRPVVQAIVVKRQ